MADEQEFPAIAQSDQNEAAASHAEHTAGQTKRRGRRTAASDADDKPAALASPEMVTYTPGPGDNPEVTWMGHKFKAHVPHAVTNARLVEMARTNKFFHVGAFDANRDGFKDEPVLPRTAEAYRAWAVCWFKDMTSIDEFAERWANEAKMRAKLEVGFDDYHYISSLAQPKIDDLIRREDEPRKVRDEIIRKGEFADLELQIAGLGQVAA